MIAKVMVKKVNSLLGRENDENIVKTSFNIPLSLRTAFKLKAVRDATTMGEVIIKLMKAYENGKIKLDEI